MSIKNADFKKAKEHFDQIISNLIGNNAETTEYFNTSLEFISDIFCKYDNKLNYYRISSAYYNFIMNAALKKNLQIDGFVYPSANTGSAGMNIALKKEIVDNKVIYCDLAIMFKGQRTPNLINDFVFAKASNEASVGVDQKFAFTHIW